VFVMCRKLTEAL